MWRSLSNGATTECCCCCCDRLLLFLIHLYRCCCFCCWCSLKAMLFCWSIDWSMIDIDNDNDVFVFMCGRSNTNQKLNCSKQKHKKTKMNVEILNKNKLRTEMKQNGKSRRQNKPIGGKGKWKYMGELKGEGKQHTHSGRERLKVCDAKGKMCLRQLEYVWGGGGGEFFNFPSTLCFQIENKHSILFSRHVDILKCSLKI